MMFLTSAIFVSFVLAVVPTFCVICSDLHFANHVSQRRVITGFNEMKTKYFFYYKHFKLHSSLNLNCTHLNILYIKKKTIGSGEKLEKSKFNVKSKKTHFKWGGNVMHSWLTWRSIGVALRY